MKKSPLVVKSVELTDLNKDTDKQKYLQISYFAHMKINQQRLHEDLIAKCGRNEQKTGFPFASMHCWLGSRVFQHNLLLA